MYFYYPVVVRCQGEPVEGITVQMNAPDEEGNWVTSECQWITDSNGYAWGCWDLNYNPLTLTAGAGGEGTGYNYNSVEVGPAPNFDPEQAEYYQNWAVLVLSVSTVTPTLTFTATSGTITYDGTRKAIGTVSYNGGNGYAYYLAKTSSGVPSASSTEGTGWVQVNTGGTVYATSSAPSNAGTYYVYLKATAHGNYAAVNPKSGGSKAISKAAGSTGVASTTMTITYSTTTGTRTVSGNTNTVSVSSSNTSVATVAISGSTITVTRKGYGSATITCSVAAATNYNAATSTFTVNCNKATGSVGTISNPAAQEYKTSGTYSFQLAMTGNTGTVTYPTSITVKKGSTTISGWTCTSAGVVTVPAGTNAASYTVTGNVTCAEGTNYYAVTTGQSRTWTVTISQKAPTLSFAAASGTLTYNGNTQDIGTVTYTGDGTAYYIVSTTNSVPGASATGWTAVTTGTTIKSSAANAGTYYVFLKSTTGTNYSAVNPKSGGNKVIRKATPGITRANVTKTYDGNTYFVTANAPTVCATPNTLTQPAGTIYYGTSSGATTYSISVPNAGGSSATNLTGSNNNMGQKDVGSKTVYVFFRPTDTTNYNDSTKTSGKVTINQANGNVGTASNPNPQNYKDGNTTNYSFQLAMSGNTGTVTYPTSITVKKGSTTISGWSCTSAGVVTVPYTQDSGSYTVTGNVTCAASSDGNYKAVTAGQSRTWTITINQVSDASVTPTINSSTLTYSASSTNRLISSTTAHGTSSYQLGYKLGSAATADSQITWGTANTATLDLPAGANAGTYYLYKKWTADSNHSNSQTYVAIGSTYTKVVNKATGNVGTVSNPAAKKFSTSSQTVQLAMTGNTGAVTYPTSITVKNSSNTTISGWSCTAAGVVTIPASTTVGSYTVTGNVTCAASSDGNYKAVTTGQSRTWTVTINKGDNQITVSPTTKTLYYHANHTGYNTATITVSNYKGTVTAVSSATSKVTVSKNSDASFTITYVAAGSATITFTDDGGTNYSSSSATCAVTTVVDTVSTYGNLTITTSPASTQSVVARGTQTTGGVQQPIEVKVTACSQTLTWASGYSETLTDPSALTVSCAVTTAKTGFSLDTSTTPNTVSVTNNTSTTARNGFVVTLTATGQGNKTASKAITFNQAAGSKVYANPVVSAYTYSTSVSAAGVTDLAPATLTYSQTWTWNGVSGSGSTISTGGTLAFTRATTYSWMTAGTNFATTGKINVASRGTTTGTARDFYGALSVTVTLNGKTSASKTCTAGKQVANEIITTQKYKNTSGTTGYNVVYTNPTCTIVSGGLAASGGYFYVVCTVTNDTNWYYKYTSGSYTSLYSGTEAGTAKWQITSNGNSRFANPTSGGAVVGSYTLYPSGASYTGSHSNMTTNATTDTVGVTAYNVGDTTKTSGEVTASVTNSLGTQHYKNTSGTTGDNWTYGTPTSVTIGSGCTAAGGSASLTCSCTDTKTYYRKYTSGSYTSLYTENPTSSITWSIYSQTCAGGTNRFSISGSTLSHSSMTSNTTYDKVTVKAANSNDSTKSANSSELSISNTLGTQHYKNTSGTTGDNWTYGTPTTASITIGSGLTAAGGSAALSCSTTDTKTYYRKYTSGTYTSLYTENPASSITWSITAQTFTPTGGSATTISRFSVSGSTLSHTTMAKNTGTDSVTVQAANANSTSLKATKSTTISNTYSDTWNNPSVSVYSYSNIGAAGGTSTPTVTASQSGTRTWTSTSTETLTGTLSYSYSMTTGNGFSINTSTGVITAEARGKYTTTRTSNTATVTVTGSGSKTGTKTATCTQSGNTYTDSWNNPSVTTYSYNNIGAAGGTSSPSVTATQSGTRTWANSAGTDTLSNTTFTYGYSMTTGNGFSINTSTGIITAEARGKYATTRTSNTATVTVTGNGKSGTKTATCTQDANTYTDSWNNPSVTAYTYASITAAGGTSSPSVTATQSGTRTWANSAGTDTLSNSTFTYSYAMTSGSGFSINTSTGVITVDGRGTTIGNARTSNTATVTVTGHSKSGTKTATLTQPGNYVTAITPRASSGTGHFKYNDITAGATSASPTLTGAATYTFSSGSTSTSAPSGGSATYTRTYSLATPTQNGFTAVNASTGVLTATSRGTTSGAARTSSTVTSDLVVTFTHNSTYSAGGTVTSSTMTSTATCTQTANALTGLSMSVGTNPIAYNAKTSVTVTATYTSGSSKDVSSTATYNDTSNPDIVEFNKTETL